MFDPYRKWLGIPEQHRPPTHYQLLSIAPDEQDREVIEAAVLRQSAFVRNFQKGPHGESATRILNDLAVAKVCLLDPMKRDAYDARLRSAKSPAHAAPTAKSARRGDPAVSPEPQPSEVASRLPEPSVPQDLPAETGEQDLVEAVRRPLLTIRSAMLAGGVASAVLVGGLMLSMLFVPRDVPQPLKLIAVRDPLGAKQGGIHSARTRAKTPAIAASPSAGHATTAPAGNAVPRLESAAPLNVGSRPTAAATLAGSPPGNAALPNTAPRPKVAAPSEVEAPPFDGRPNASGSPAIAVAEGAGYLPSDVSPAASITAPQSASLASSATLASEARGPRQTTPLTSRNPLGGAVAPAEPPSVELWESRPFGEIRRLTVPKMEMSSLAFSPSGGWLAIGGQRGRAILWSMDAPDLAPTLLNGDSFGRVGSLAFSPDDMTLLVGMSDGVIRRFALDGKQPREIGRLVGHTGQVERIIVHGPNADLVISGGADGSVRQWTLKDGQQTNIFRGFSGAVRGLWLSADEKRLIASDGKLVGFAELNLKKPPKNTTVANPGSKFEVSPNGRYLITAGAGRLFVQDLRGLREIKPFVDESEQIDTVRFSPDGRFLLAVARQSSSISVLDFAKRTKRFALEGHSSVPSDVQVSPDAASRLVASCAADGSARVWRLPELLFTADGAAAGSKKTPATSAAE